MARKPMRVKISCSVVYSKPQNSIWIKSCAVSTDRPFLTDCLIDLSRTVRYWRWRAYCKSGTNCSVRNAKKYRGVQNVRTEQNTEPVKKKCFQEKWWWNRNKRTTTTSSSTVHGNAKRVRKWLDLRAGGPRGVDKTCKRVKTYWIAFEYTGKCGT